MATSVQPLPEVWGASLASLVLLSCPVSILGPKYQGGIYIWFPRIMYATILLFRSDRLPAQGITV
jgi:membrane-bound inhibitor of C-type lysozyme